MKKGIGALAFEWKNISAKCKELTDAQWQVIEKILNQTRKRKYELRAIVNAILWVLRTGSQWRNLPGGYPPWQSVYYYFRRWQANGLLERLNSELNQAERIKQGKKTTPSLLCIDSQSVKVAAFVSKDKGIDGNKRINGNKRHLIVDTLPISMTASRHPDWSSIVWATCIG